MSSCAATSPRCSRISPRRGRLAYCSDMNGFAKMNIVYARRSSAPFPARTTRTVAASRLCVAVEMDLGVR